MAGSSRVGFWAMERMESLTKTEMMSVVAQLGTDGAQPRIQFKRMVTAATAVCAAHLAQQSVHSR